MELVYLWVEAYKNIHNQGFNFSPRFHCDFKAVYKKDEDGKDVLDEENSELIICDKKKKECTDNDYIENFFGENINVTAIVGKNGSGKSSVIEFLLDRLAERYENNSKNFIFIYSYANQLYANHNFKCNIDKKVDINSNLNSDHILQDYEDLITLHINSEYKDIEIRHTQQIFSENNKYDKHSSNIVFIENYIYNKELLKKLKENIFTLDYLQISIKTTGFFNSSILYEDRDYYSDDDWDEIKTKIGSVNNKNFIERLKRIQEIFDLKYNKHQNKNVRFFLGDRNTPYKYNEFNDELLENIPDLFKYNRNQNIKIKVEELNKEILEYIQKLPYIYEINLFDKNNINIDSLSFGEKQLLTQLHYILKYVTSKTYDYYVPPYSTSDGDEAGDYYEKKDIKTCLIFLDEFEIGLHPEWQKKTIKYIVDFLQVVDIKTHLILTTHSPFLLSDIPKQNIIFLDTNEEGKCKVVDGLIEKKQTFGANIHTLLSDSFFMEDGLMGEFAKGKIDKAIALLNQEHLSDEELKYCEQIISIIGEPIVKNQLQRMLDSKRLKKIDEIDKLYGEIELIKDRIEIMRKNQ